MMEITGKGRACILEGFTKAEDVLIQSMFERKKKKLDLGSLKPATMHPSHHFYPISIKKYACMKPDILYFLGKTVECHNRYL